VANKIDYRALHLAAFQKLLDLIPPDLKAQSDIMELIRLYGNTGVMEAVSDPRSVNKQLRDDIILRDAMQVGLVYKK